MNQTVITGAHFLVQNSRYCIRVAGQPIPICPAQVRGLVELHSGVMGWYCVRRKLIEPVPPIIAQGSSGCSGVTAVSGQADGVNRSRIPCRVCQIRTR